MVRGTLGRACAALALAGLTALATGCGPASEADDDLARVGLLRIVPDDDHAAFVSELRSLGWDAGTEVVLDPNDTGTVFPDAEAARSRLEEWQAAGPLDLLVAFSTPFARLAAETAPGVPTLFLVNDPVAAGLVTDLEQPEGNLTGVTFRAPADRTIDLARRAVGGLERLGYLAPLDDPAVPGHRAGVLAAAEELGVEVVEATFDGPEGVAAAVAELAQAEVEAVYLANANGTFRAHDELDAALRDAGLPAVGNTDILTFAVVVLAPDGAEVRRQLARQAARILSGTPVGSVPVEHPRKFVVIVGATQAERLGLPPLPEDLLRQADVVR